MPESVIRFQIESELHAEYAWVVVTLGRFAGFTPVFVEEDPDVTISELGISDIQVSHFFRQQYLHGDFSSRLYFDKSPLHYCANGKPDYLSSCFYMLACLQEYADFVGDKYQRFSWAVSWQKHFGSVEENLVAQYFTALIEQTPVLQEKVVLPDATSRLFLSHDIDTLFGALGEQWRPLVKKGRIGSLLQLIMNHFFRTPDYQNIDRILDMESAHDVRSVFFWLTERGRGKNGIDNADYHIDDPKVITLRKKVVDAGGRNGLHKSALKTTYGEELLKLGEEPVQANRNHYLRLFMPDTWKALENAGISLDSTLGFPDHPGFRAGYGMPFQPYCLTEKRAYSVTEVPLLVMDTSYRYYLKMNPDQAAQHLLDFLEKHKRHAVLTLLWHNNYFLDRAEPGWLDIYKQVLLWARDNKMASALPEELIISP